MFKFSRLSGSELVALSSTFALTISKGLKADELIPLGRFFSSVSKNIDIIATTKIVDIVEEAIIEEAIVEDGNIKDKRNSNQFIDDEFIDDELIDDIEFL